MSNARYGAPIHGESTPVDCSFLDSYRGPMTPPQKQPHPHRPYPFALEQVTGKNPAPAPLTPEEEQRQWDAIPALETEDGMGWEHTFSTLYDGDLAQTHPARAEYLQSNGYSAQDLTEVCSIPRSLRLRREPEDLEPAEVEEHAAFINEVAVYFSYWERRVMDRRNGYIMRLGELGWTQSRIASLLGMTKQRVQTIINNPRNKVAPGPAAEVKAGWSREAGVVDGGEGK